MAHMYYVIIMGRRRFFVWPSSSQLFRPNQRKSYYEHLDEYHIKGSPPFKAVAKCGTNVLS